MTKLVQLDGSGWGKLQHLPEAQRSIIRPEFENPSRAFGGSFADLHAVECKCEAAELISIQFSNEIIAKSLTPMWQSFAYFETMLVVDVSPVRRLLR
jgi:hypothetical protein